MKRELDEYLCKVYPKMMVNRDKPMTETAMCWGFECGDGWFQILNQLMGNIQHHLDWKERQREVSIKFNRIAEQLKAGDSTLFDEEYKDMIDGEFKEKRRQQLIDRYPTAIPEPIPQVTLDQVKEKFGTLRFYYTGGDDVIDGMVRMAESMSGVTCEVCGKPGTSTGGSWIKTACVEHGGQDFDTPEDELEEQKILKEGFEQ
jgi:hypothetical protein